MPIQAVIGLYISNLPGSKGVREWLTGSKPVVCIRNAILDHSLPGVHGALLVRISIVLRYSYSVGLSIAVVLEHFDTSPFPTL